MNIYDDVSAVPRDRWKIDLAHLQKYQVNSQSVLEQSTAQVHALAFAGKLVYRCVDTLQNCPIKGLSPLGNVREGDPTQRGKRPCGRPGGQNVILCKRNGVVNGDHAKYDHDITEQKESCFPSLISD